VTIFRGSSEKPCRFREIDTIATSLYSSGGGRAPRAISPHGWHTELRGSAFYGHVSGCRSLEPDAK
jgi:hypothetical protein